MANKNSLSFALVAGVVLAAPVCRADESLPVVHPEPITIHVFDGKGGKPMAHMHVVLVAGYDDTDLGHALWQTEAITDDDGTVNLPNALKNFGYLHVSVLKRKLCQVSGSPAGFSLDRIRNDGLSTPNRCGTTVVEDKPGVLNVFVKATGKDFPQPAPAEDPDDTSTPDDPAASSAPASAPAAKESFRLPLTASNSNARELPASRQEAGVSSPRTPGQ